MRGTYHLCYSSHDEILHRDQDDFNYAFNCFAIAVLETEARALCESFQSTHLHNLVQCDSPKYLFHIARYAYSRYFNAKYHRHGRLGEKNVHVTAVQGNSQTAVCSSYILRQNLHHGVSVTPFDNPNCSINCIFRKELGHPLSVNLISDNLRYRYLPKGVTVPTSYRMASSGLLVRDDIIDTAYMEQLYVSPRNFMFQMNRKSGEEWEREQREADPKSSVVTLNTIELADADSAKKMMQNEYGKINNNSMTDMELCQLIDKKYVLRYDSREGATIYDLGDKQRAALGNSLYEDIRSHRVSKFATVKQIVRCCVISDSRQDY